jgi:hypothetical protein
VLSKKKKQNVSYMHGLDTGFFFTLSCINTLCVCVHARTLLFHKLNFDSLHLGLGMVWYIHF